MDYKLAYLNTLLLLHSAFMLSLVKMLLKRQASGHALNSQGYYYNVYLGKSWKSHEIVLLNFCGNPAQAIGRWHLRCTEIHLTTKGDVASLDKTSL